MIFVRSRSVNFTLPFLRSNLYTLRGALIELASLLQTNIKIYWPEKNKKWEGRASRAQRQKRKGEERESSRCPGKLGHFRFKWKQQQREVSILQLPAPRAFLPCSTGDSDRDTPSCLPTQLSSAWWYSLLFSFFVAGRQGGWGCLVVVSCFFARSWARNRCH